MGLPNEVNSALIGAAAAGGYEIQQSLRFDGSSKLSRTPSSAGTTTTWTLSYWIKIGSLTAEQAILSAPAPGGGYTATWYSAGATSRVKINQYNHPTNIYSKCPTPVYRDPSAWFHVVVVYDSTNATAGDRVRFYVNGVRLTDFSDDGSSVGGTTNPSQNQTSGINNNSIQYIGSQFDGTYAFTNSYLAEMHLLDGTAVTNAEDFGELDDNGVWRPIEVSGVTYGTNGWYMKFDPAATNGIGHDHSGNGNNFTATGFDTSGSTGSSSSDVVIDSPTNNFAVLNSLMKRQDRDLEDCVKESGLRFKKNDGNRQYIASSIACPGSGKWYFEFTVNVHQLYVGVAERGTWNSLQGITTNSVLLQMDSSSNYYIRNYYTSSTQNLSGEASNGQVYSMRYDADNGTVAFYNASGTQFGSTVTGLTTGVERFFFISGQSGADSYCNFGQQDWAHTLPSGYKALNIANLPEPTIKDGGKYFNTVLYSGSSNNTQSITGVGFQPDMTWIKARNSTDSHTLSDAVRGAGIALRTNSTAAEANNSSSFTSFNSDGFTVAGASGDTNQTGINYVAWNWDAGGTGSSNTAGTITSTVSANASAGFSIVTYTGNATSNATVGHGLGVAPAMLIVKNRSNSNWWKMYHKSLGIGYYINLNDNYAASNSVVSNVWGSSAPSSTVFSLGSGGDGSTNSSGNNYVAYCFSEVEGYSKFGSYIGNGSSTFIYTGFRPAMIITRMSSGADNWNIYDNARNTYNAVSQVLYPDLANAEDALSNSLDFLSNGFKVNAYANNSGSTYIFAAFAELPFKYANVR